MNGRLAARGALASLGLLGLVLLAGCGGGPTSTPSVEASATAAAAPTPSTTEPTTGAVADLGLLEVLPTSIGGLAVTPSLDAAELTAADPTLAAWIGAVAYAVVVDPATSETAIVAVAGAHPGQLDDAAYRGYRDTFDPAACERAGGVLGNAEAELGERAVQITTCADGVVIYHLRLADPDRVVSVTSVGDGALGRRIVESIEG